MLQQHPEAASAIYLRSYTFWVLLQLYRLKSCTHHTSCFFINLLKSIKFALKLFDTSVTKKLAMASGGLHFPDLCFRDPLLALSPLIPLDPPCCHKCVIYLLLCWPYANIYLLSRTSYAGIIGGSLLTVNTYIYSCVCVCMSMFHLCVLLFHKNDLAG